MAPHSLSNKSMKRRMDADLLGPLTRQKVRTKGVIKPAMKAFCQMGNPVAKPFPKASKAPKTRPARIVSIKNPEPEFFNFKKSESEEDADLIQRNRNRKLKQLLLSARGRCDILEQQLMDSDQRVAQLTKQLNEMEDLVLCPICMDERRDTALKCGHTLCSSCSEPMTSCPVCRKRISRRIRLYH
mmetsp:Transcript_36034/g.80201  ORF Transcript_36034/g.80201 Transcript_36034/m.80201 type:complete len:185 (-) Transcript_36034:984-1538(-)